MPFSTAFANLKERRLVNWVLPLIIFTLFWAGLFLYSGTLTSGYHLIDDHEMVRMSGDLNNRNFFDVSSEWLLRDLATRFRPIYYLHRILVVQVLGTDFVLLSLQNLGLLIATSWLLFLFCKNLKFKAIYSFIFVFTGLVGMQTAIWWRLGPNEAIGLFLLSLGFYFLSKSYKVKNHSRYRALAVFFTLLASLCKESFVMMIPVVLFTNFYLYHQKHSVSLFKNIWQNKFFNLILTVILAIEAILVFFVVGTNRIGYAGGDADSLNPIKILSTFRYLALDSNWQLLLFVVFTYFLGLGIYYYRERKWPQKRYVPLVASLIAFILIVLPQVILHVKSGIYERYLIPGTLGFSFLILFLISQSISFLKDRRARYLLLVVILVFGGYFFYLKVKGTLFYAKQFAADGRTVNAALQAVEQNSTESDSIIIAAEPVQNYEEGYSLKYYLPIVAKRPNLYYEVISDVEAQTDFEQGLKRGFVSAVNATELESLPDPTSASVVFVFSNIEEKFLNSSQGWFVPEDYTRYGYIRYVVYAKND